MELARRWHGDDAVADWTHIPLLRRPIPLTADGASGQLRSAARAALGIREDDFVVCSFGHLGPIKMNRQLLDSWIASSLAISADCQLVFVGQQGSDTYSQDLCRDLYKLNTRVRVTGFVDADMYRQWLHAADVAVQLRMNSRGETSAAVLDCWNAGVATVVNAHGALAELPADCVLMLPNALSDTELASALEGLYKDKNYRNKIGGAGRARLLAYHDPRQCAAAYATAIEASYERANRGGYGLLKRLPSLVPDAQIAELFTFAQDVSVNLPVKARRLQWLIDCSTLVRSDDRTGIQRVVRAILQNLLQNPPENVAIEPVYAEPGRLHFRYARKSRLID
jgi:hypothetical protein